jgi:hypothetical protein
MFMHVYACLLKVQQTSWQRMHHDACMHLLPQTPGQVRWRLHGLLCNIAGLQKALSVLSY